LTTTQLFAPAALAGAAAPATNGGVVVAVDPLGAAFEASAPPMSAIAMIATAITQPTPKVGLECLSKHGPLHLSPGALLCTSVGLTGPDCARNGAYV
jgi:hypothetical protein